LSSKQRVLYYSLGVSSTATGGLNLPVSSNLQPIPAGFSGVYSTRTQPNDASGASLSSNQITLPSGTYFIHASAPAFMISQSRLRLQNITDSTTTLLGENNTADSSVASSCISFVIGRFTIASSKTFELQHIGRVQRGSGQGFGLGVASFGITEVFAQVLIWKVA
jgi:hypothetical protein